MNPLQNCPVMIHRLANASASTSDFRKSRKSKWLWLCVPNVYLRSYSTSPHTHAGVPCLWKQLWFTAIKSLTTQVVVDSIVSHTATLIACFFHCHITECAWSFFCGKHKSPWYLQTMFLTVPIHYFPPPGVHSFIHSGSEGDRGGCLKISI